MLIEFTVRNFRSIKTEQTFSMLSTNEVGNDHRIHKPDNNEDYHYLKGAAIYGANGSGKSNWFYALHSFWQLIIHSGNLMIEDRISSYNPFVFDEDSHSEPTLFEIEFLAGDNFRYKYRVEFDEFEILSEKLVYYPNKREVLIFDRNDGHKITFGQMLKGNKRTLQNLLLKNNLFLSRGGNSDNEQLKQIYLFIKHRFLFSGIDKMNSINNFTSLYLMNRENVQFKQLLLDFMKAADSGVIDIDIRKRSHPDSPNLISTMESKLFRWETLQPVTFHKVYKNGLVVGKREISLEDESIGTQKMYSLGGLIIHTLLNGITLLVDELDTSFHPLMSEYIIGLFSNPQTNASGAQIVFTTQDTSLLNEENFRRDQIWFAEKDEQGSTHLYSLYEFEKTELKKCTIASWYLTGRFGALPFINKSLLNICKEEEDMIGSIDDIIKLD